MRAYTGQELGAFLADKPFHSYKKRRVFREITEYLSRACDEHVLVLRGLRRTGKTTLMYQAIEELGDYDSTLFIRCYPEDDIIKIADAIQDFPGKYVFLDEVTKVPNFIDFASILPDECTPTKRIVLTGTDSLGFAIAKTGELFDRVVDISTTYIPFSEQHRLLGTSLETYMKYGGTLTGENYFYNEDGLDEYTNSAIVDNLAHTLQYWKDGERGDYLYPAMTREDFHSLVVVFLREESKRFLLKSVTKQFKASEFGSAAQMFESQSRKESRIPEKERTHIPDPKVLRSESLCKEFASLLEVRESYSVPVDERLIDRLKEALFKMDVLTYIKETGEYYFTQPGMRYCHLDLALHALENNRAVTEKYSAEDIRLVKKKITEDLEGRLIEDIVLMDCRDAFKNDPNFSVFKFRPLSEREYDMVILNKAEQSAAVFEIKRSSSKYAGQKRQVESNELSDLLQFQTGALVCAKAVLYQGETGADSDGFRYINLTEFLSDVPAALERAFPWFSISKGTETERE